MPKFKSLLRKLSLFCHTASPSLLTLSHSTCGYLSFAALEYHDIINLTHDLQDSTLNTFFHVLLRHVKAIIHSYVMRK